jgi:SAM-dependent methyltransferase
MINPDYIWKEIVNSKGKNKKLIEASKMSTILKYVERLTKGNKSVRVLDYGCGGGQLLTYLRLLGYKNLIGVDVYSAQINKQLGEMYINMGFESDVFFTYDGVLLPFDDSSFDVIISQQVLEHVHNVEGYFLESKRVLSLKGEMLLDFPHRLVPFDTHTRMWFVHYFPLKVRNFFYNKYRDNKSHYYSNLLNLKTVWYYKRLLNELFSATIDISEDRIANFTYQDYYEGNLKVRLFFHKLINLPFVGSILRKFLHFFVNATFIIKN